MVIVRSLPQRLIDRFATAVVDRALQHPSLSGWVLAARGLLARPYVDELFGVGAVPDDLVCRSGAAALRAVRRAGLR